MEPTLAVVERAGTALGSLKPRRSLVAQIAGATKQVALALRCAKDFAWDRFVRDRFKNFATKRLQIAG